MPHGRGEGSGHPQHGTYAPHYSPQRIQRAIQHARPAPNVGGYRHGRYQLRRRARPRRQTRPHGLDRHQARNAKAILHEGHKVGADRKQRLAAIITALTEARLRNVHYGDRDSLGVFQQRPSQGWGPPSKLLQPRYAARKFYEMAKHVDHRGLSPGDLAQAVQRSGYPDRYRQRVPQGLRILHSFGEV